MSRSSWTATAAGRRSAACRASPAIAPVPRRCARRSKAAAEGRRRSAYALCLFVGELAAVGGGGQRPQGPAAAIISNASSTSSSAKGVRLRLIGDPAAFGAATGRAARARGRADRRQRPADPGRRAQLWLARAKLPQPRASWPQRVAAGELRSRRRSTRHALGAELADRRPARPRPADPHFGRDAAVEFPAVAGGLCRTDVRRHAVARLRRGGLQPTRSTQFAGAPAAVWRPMSELAIRSRGRRRS